MTDSHIYKGADARSSMEKKQRHVLTLVLGLGLAFFLFAAIYVSVHKMMRENYVRLTAASVEKLAEKISDLKHTVRGLSTSLDTVKPYIKDQYSLQNFIKEAVPGLENFAQIIWLYQDHKGSWVQMNLYVNTSYGVSLSDRIHDSRSLLVSYIEDKKVLSSESAKIFLDIPVFSKPEFDPRTDVSYKYYAVVKSLEKDNPKAGIIVGVSDVGAILRSSGEKEWHRLGRLLITDQATSSIMYDMDSSSSKGAIYRIPDQDLKIDVGTSLWIVKAQFFKDANTKLLEKIPFFALFLGGLGTGLALFYLRLRDSQKERLAEAKAELEQKNFALEDRVEEIQKLNQTLKKSELENRAIIDSVSEIIFEITEKGEIAFLNKAWAGITGFETEQFIGKDFFTILHPQEQEIQRKEFEMMLKGQRQNVRSLTRIREAGGHFRAVEMTLSMIKRNEGMNEDQHVVGILTDIEERRRAEKALSEAEKKYRMIVENAAGGIFQLTPEGLYLSANPAMAEILGYDSPEDILRSIKNANENVYGDIRRRMIFNRELDSKGEIQNHEVEVFRKDGSKIWVNENIRVVKDGNGHVLYYEGSLADITERKKSGISLAQAKLQSDLANRAKSEFLANMSHELRTPLNSIIGFSEIIKDEVFGPLEQRQYWEYAADIHKSGKRLLNIINDILDISKIEAGERQLNESAVDLKAVVESCIDLMAEKIQSNAMNIVQDLENLPKIVAEEISVKQIVINILSNAIKFTPAGGTITIAGKINQDSQMVLSFTDTGIGLEKEEIKKALSPFGQIDSDLSRRGSGTGLGLTLVKALIEIHGGELELLSEKGIGTTVNVIFPAQRVSRHKEKSAGSASNVVNLKS